MPSTRKLPTREERAAATVDARRESRYRFAKSRVQKIADGEPALTTEQRCALAAELLPDDYLRELVASWPPLSADQRATIATLLSTPDKGAAAA